MTAATMEEIGFTGTQLGMSSVQRETVRYWLAKLGGVNFRYGMCVGADDEAAEAARALGYHLIGYPGPDLGRRGAVVPDELCHDIVRSERNPFLARDARIAFDSGIVIAAPAQFHEVRRSGTWTTIRRARKYGRELIYAWRDGTVTTAEAAGKKRGG